MRLGEFYLNYAEAMYNYYNNADTPGEFDLTANGAINILRDRQDVQMPHWSGTPDNWLEKYERERFVELAFEDHRFWDLRRWKQGDKLKTIKIANITKDSNGDIILTRNQKERVWYEKFYFFPISFSEINKNHNLVQNPGWENNIN